MTMTHKNRLRVSLVIPAYNEESHLAGCLEAIAAQSVQPFEVIVVDNNSTDQTVAIARRYPFVKVLHEKRQGVVFARDTGFNAARGDIIGRTDGDSILAPDWVMQVQRTFANSSVEGASGIVSYRDIGLQQTFGAIDSLVRHYLAKRLSVIDELFLYGVNMAVRREAWQSVRSNVCHERHLHEDLDLAIHMAKRRQRIVFAPTMQASISPRQASASPREFSKYVWSNPRVYAEHGMVAQRYMYPIALFVMSLYLPIKLLYRGYNPDTQRFSITRALTFTPPERVSPVSDLL
jgi:glycosyltransferase involved in cell wall biosynthesis